MLDEQVGVQERQLDGVLDRLDLRSQPTDVGVGDVGDLLEDELLDLGARQPLECVAGAGLHQERVPGPQRRLAQRVGEAHDLLVVGMTDHERPVVVETLLQRHHVADPFVGSRLDHVQRLVEHDLLPVRQVVDVDVGTRVHPQLAALREDLHDVALVAAQEHSEAGGGRRELLDLLLERDDLVARLTKGVGELRVLGVRRGELAAHLQEPLLQGARPAGAVLQPPPQQGGLLLEEPHLGPQIGDVAARRVLTVLCHRWRLLSPARGKVAV